MSNALDSAAYDVDADRPRRPNLRRRAKSDLADLIAFKVSFAIRIQDKVVLALMNAQLQTQKDLTRLQIASEAEIIDSTARLAKLIERSDRGETIEIEECLSFMDKVTDNRHRQKLIPRICDLTTHFVRKHMKSARDTRGMTSKIEAIEAYARRVTNEKDETVLKNLMSPAKVLDTFKALLPGA